MLIVFVIWIELEALTIDIFFSNLFAFISPRLELSFQKVLSHWVKSRQISCLRCIVFPISIGKRLVDIRHVLVENGVPGSVKVTGTINVGNPLIITTPVSFREVSIDHRGVVERLMHVTDVVNDKT